ncbi:hypothetical protein ACA910_010911 [Epithemia clementina (nom. ined.)]
MVRELSYTTITHVMESWEQVRRMKDYETTAGKILFQQLFKKEPKTRVLFGFPIDLDTDSQELLQSKRFLMHASYLIEMLDTALQMLGPDIDLLTEIMLDLGAKHQRYGVGPDMFPVMGEALLYTLKATLKGDFTKDIEQAWIETYKELSGDMIRGQKLKK